MSGIKRQDSGGSGDVEQVFIPRAAMNETFGAGDVSPLNSAGLQWDAASGDSRPPLRKCFNLGRVRFKVGHPPPPTGHDENLKWQSGDINEPLRVSSPCRAESLTNGKTRDATRHRVDSDVQ